MTSTRRASILEEIERRTGRLPQSADLIGASYELSLLKQWLGRPADATHELRRLVPIRVIACVEGCLKAGAAELIDHGDPYRSNARKLFQQVRIDFDVLSALLDDRVSVGEIAVHSVGWQDLAEINSRLSTLLGFEFFEQLKHVQDRWKIEREGKEKKPIIDSLDKVLADLSDALTVRHVLCHETAQIVRVSEVDAHRFLESGEQFTRAVNWLISETLRPNAPLTQTDMNIEAGRRAATADDELAKELDLLSKRLDSEEDRALLDQAQAAWAAYRGASVELEGLAYKGGTIRPLIHSSAWEAMTRRRIEELTETRLSPEDHRPRRGRKRSRR